MAVGFGTEGDVGLATLARKQGERGRGRRSEEGTNLVGNPLGQRRELIVLVMGVGVVVADNADALYRTVLVDQAQGPIHGWGQRQVRMQQRHSLHHTHLRNAILTLARLCKGSRSASLWSRSSEVLRCEGGHHHLSEENTVYRARRILQRMQDGHNVRHLRYMQQIWGKVGWSVQPAGEPGWLVVMSWEEIATA